MEARTSGMGATKQRVTTQPLGVNSTHATTWASPEDIMLSDIGQARKDKPRVIPRGVRRTEAVGGGCPGLGRGGA